MPCQQDAASCRSKGQSNPWALLCADLSGPSRRGCYDLAFARQRWWSEHSPRLLVEQQGNLKCVDNAQQGAGTVCRKPPLSHTVTSTWPSPAVPCGYLIPAESHYKVLIHKQSTCTISFALTNLSCSEMAGVSTSFLAHSTEQIPDDTTKVDQTRVHEDVSDGLMICRCEPDRTAAPTAGMLVLTAPCAWPVRHCLHHVACRNHLRDFSRPFTQWQVARELQQRCCRCNLQLTV